MKLMQHFVCNTSAYLPGQLGWWPLFNVFLCAAIAAYVQRQLVQLYLGSMQQLQNSSSSEGKQQDIPGSKYSCLTASAMQPQQPRTAQKCCSRCVLAKFSLPLDTQYKTLCLWSSASNLCFACRRFAPISFVLLLLNALQSLAY